MASVLQARENPDGPTLIVRDLLAMQRAGHRSAVTAIIHMVIDLQLHGRESRYALPLKGLPIWELKTRARGGLKGGARVYFFWRVDGVAVLCGAETKAGDTASPHLLQEAVSKYRDYLQKGVKK